MQRLIAIFAVLLAAASAATQGPTPTPAEVRAVVERLGSADFQEREAATKRLEELGPVAIEALRVGAKSEDPETARRALDLLRKAERRVANEKTLTPTLVELDVKDQPLDAVLAELSKQVKCEVVLGGLKPEDAASKKVSVSTGGKVPFWSAVLKVCDVGGLQIAGAGGFLAPGAMPYLGRAKAGVRVAADRGRAVVLEARGDSPARPASVNGAVLVEALPVPRHPGSPIVQPTFVLQVWPEPRFRWEGMAATRFTRASDASGNPLAAELLSQPMSGHPSNSGAVRDTHEKLAIIRNPDGSFTTVRATETQAGGWFRPNSLQALVRFKGGEKSPTVAKELDLSLFASVRSDLEPLCTITGVEANKATTATGPGGSELSFSYGTDAKGKLTANVHISYEANAVQTATVSDDLPGVRGGAAGFGNHTVYGVRVADPNGKPFTLGLVSGSNQFDAAGKRVVLKLQLELHADREGQGPPGAVTLWGTYSKSVEVPVLLRDVPLTSGK